jgi:hypothetical protein
MGEVGRVYLSAAALSRLIHQSKCAWCSSGFALGAISFAANDSKQRCQSGCRITEKEYGALALPLKEKLANISAATIDRLLSPVRAKTRPKGCGEIKPGDG